MTPNIKRLVKKLKNYTDNGCGLEAKIELANYFGFEGELVELKELKLSREKNNGLTADEWEKAYNIKIEMLEKLKAFNVKVYASIYNAL